MHERLHGTEIDLNRNRDGSARVARSHSAFDVALTGKAQVDRADIRSRDNLVASSTEAAHPGNEYRRDVEAARCASRCARTSGVPRGDYQSIVQGIAASRRKWRNVVEPEIALSVCIGLHEDDE